MSNGGMKVPKGIDALAGAVPEEIPDELFTEDEAVTSAKKQAALPPSERNLAIPTPLSSGKMPVAKAVSSARMPAAKPASIPRMPAVKPPLPTSTAKMAAVKPPAPPSAPQVPAAPPLSMPDMPPEPTPAIPSSFPSVGKQLVVELAPPPAPSSLDALVTAIEPEPISTRAPTSTPEPFVQTALPADDEPLPAGLPAPLASRARFVMLSALVAAGIVAIGGSFLWSARAGIQTAVGGQGARAETVVAPPVTAVPAPPPAPLPPPPAPEAKEAAPPAPEPPPAVDVPAGMGRVKTAGSTAGRRIFVDQRTVGQTPEAVVVKCGSHRVRIGSTGKTVSVDVPCGGEIEVRDR